MNRYHVTVVYNERLDEPGLGRTQIFTYVEGAIVEKAADRLAAVRTAREVFEKGWTGRGTLSFVGETVVRLKVKT